MTRVNLRSKPQTRMVEYVNAFADPIPQSKSYSYCPRSQESFKRLDDPQPSTLNSFFISFAEDRLPRPTLPTRLSFSLLANMMSDWDTSFLPTSPPDEQGDSLAIGLESIVVQVEYR